MSTAAIELAIGLIGPEEARIAFAPAAKQVQVGQPQCAVDAGNSKGQKKLRVLYSKKGKHKSPPTLFPINPDQTPVSPLTTELLVLNADFMAMVFVGLEPNERPMVLGIPGPINAKTAWPTGTAWVPAVITDDASINWFFTLSTYRPKDGTYRRRKDQFARAFGVMLDDIGTKAAPRERLDACPPSYVIETSAGNFQAGYLFDQPCADLAQVDALQEALVKAGLCDPGAKGPSARVGRLPCGVNGKYNPPQDCRLVEWHPERRYSPDQIIELLELEPVEPVGIRRNAKTRKSASVKGSAEADVYRSRAKENAVLSALRQRGLYKQPLGGGRHDITCPWVHEHTDHVDHGSAYFEPSDLYPVGGFNCQHSHGDGKRISALLEFLSVTFTDAKHKPTIRVQAGELHRVVDAAERELASGDRHYQRGGLIVGVVTDPGTSETSIRPVSANALMRALSSCATWTRFDARSGGDVVTDPPAKHVNVLFDSEIYQHLPVLRGIARQPYFRPDGSLMTAAGFDLATGMFGVFDERAFDIPAEPDKSAAECALAELRALLAEFSFSQDHDLSAALAMILTAAIRPALPVAPMGHVKAPQIASGKSYLSQLIAAFAGPSKPSAYAFPSSEDECAKLLLSALMEAPPVLMFDNLTGDLVPFKSLCSALTEQHLTGRILGISKTATVPTQTLFLSSGNNVDSVRDMTRRVITISLDPACETPATRKFSGDPVGTVQRDRARFVSLALTVVRAYVFAGCPAQELRPLGTYGEWTRLARAPLVWLGMSDPATSVYSRMAEDPDRETLGRLLSAWRGTFGDEPTAIREVVERAEQFISGSKELAEVVREIAEERGIVNRRRLGRWVARHQGRIVDGVRFERCGKASGSERWRAVVMGLSEVSDDALGATVSQDCDYDAIL